MNIEEIKLQMYRDVKEGVGGDYGFFSVGFDFGYNQTTKPLLDEIEMLKFQLKAADSDYATKSDETNEAVEFMDWVIKNEYYYNGTYWYKDFAKDKLTTNELYEIFKSK